MKKITLLLSALVASLTMSAEVVTLDLSKPTNPESFEFNEAGMWKETWNDQDYPYFESQIFGFSHLLSGDSYGGTSWDGFTVSKATKDGEGYGYYSNMAKGGIRGTGTPYILGYYSEYWLKNEDNEDMTSSNLITFTDGKEYYPRYVYVNNSLVGHHDVTEGDYTGYKFQKGDKFELWIQALDEDFYHELSDDKVVYRLADYTSENEEEWFVNTEWAKVDLSELGACHGLAFTLVSTATGAYGTNTSLYFALDGLTVSTTADEPLPVKVAGFENETWGINLTAAESNWFGADEPIEGMNNWMSGTYRFQTYHSVSDWGAYNAAAVVTNETSTAFKDYNDAYRSVSGGAFEGANYAVWYIDGYNNGTVSFDPQVVKGFFVNNNVYAVSSMSKGDSFAKKFGNDDWFKLTITGSKEGAAGKSVEFYLAKDGEYVADWTYVDLSELGEIDGLTFAMSSSDASEWGMNTPAYFCMDNFGAEKPEGYVEPARAKFPETVAIEFTSATSENIRWDDETADPKTGWWQIMAWDDTYYLSFSNAGTIAQAAGTYTLDDLDEEFSYLYLIDGEEETRITLTEVKITVSISEEGVVRVTGYALSADNKYYAINIEYSAPTAAQTVNVSIPDAKLIDTYASSGLYGIYGISAEQIYVQLAVWANDLSGDFTEEDLDNQYLGSGVITDQKQHAIYTATIKVVPGNAEGAYKLTADLLCYNNTLYKVEMIVPGVDAVETIISEMKAQKVIVNGQLLIISDGKTFNIQGVQL